jgi:hypothetical protein
MEPILITTPSGYKVTFKPFVSFGVKRQIQRVLMASAKVDPKDPDKIEFSPAAMLDSQDLAVKLLVERIEVKGQETTYVTIPEQVLETIQGWPEPDGQAVYDKIDQLTNSTEDPKKRGI